MVLREATKADLPEVVELINLAYRGSVGWAVETQYIEGQRVDLAGLREDLAANPQALLLVWREEQDGRLLGSVWLEPAEGEAWYLGLLSVRPEMQDRQLGRQLLAGAEEVVRRNGGRRVRMSVVSLRHTLIAWYERRGYELTGETQPFPYGDERVGRPLRDDLHFVMLEKAL
jgi:ribosomal protein S18 acetylase RimI-like enzyme